MTPAKRVLSHQKQWLALLLKGVAVGRVFTEIVAKLTESHVEEATLEWLCHCGWQVAYGMDVSTDCRSPGRASNSNVVLATREELIAAVRAVDQGAA